MKDKLKNTLRSKAFIIILTLTTVTALTVVAVIVRSAKQKSILKIGVMSDVDSVQVAVAAYLLDNAELVLFSDAYSRSCAFRNGSIDICVSDMITAVCEISAGRNDKILTVTSGTYSLVSRHYSLSLAAESVGISQNTVIEYAADRIFESTPYTAVPVNSLAARYSALLTGSLDSALLPEPYAEMATNMGFNRIASLENSEVGVLCCNEKAVTKKEKLITDFLEAFEKAADICNNDPLGETVKNAFEFLSLNNVSDTALPYYMPPFLPSEKTIDSVCTYLRDKNICVPEKLKIAGSLWKY